MQPIYLLILFKRTIIYCTSTRQLSVSNAQSALWCIKKLKHAVIKWSSVCQTKVFEGAQSSVFHCVKLDCCWYKPLPIERARVLSVLLLWKFVWPEGSKCISFGQWPWRCGFRQTAVVRGGGWDATWWKCLSPMHARNCLLIIIVLHNMSSHSCDSRGYIHKPWKSALLNG